MLGGKYFPERWLEVTFEGLIPRRLKNLLNLYWKFPSIKFTSVSAMSCVGNLRSNGYSQKQNVFWQLLLISAVHGPYWLSSSIFPCWFVCLFVRPSRYGNTQSNLHFFQYIQALKPHINPVPLNSKQYQVILTQYHQVPTSTAFYWLSTIIYHIQMSDFPFLTWDELSCTCV